MSKTILVFETSTLDHEPTMEDNVGDIARSNAIIEVFLCKDGKWVIRKYIGAHNSGAGTTLDFADIRRHADFMDVIVELAESVGIDLKHPQAPSPVCSCPKECDCQDPDGGSLSMHCPIHNDVPTPDLNCPQHGHVLL